MQRSRSSRARKRREQWREGSVSECDGVCEHRGRAERGKGESGGARACGASSDDGHGERRIRFSNMKCVVSYSLTLWQHMFAIDKILKKFY